MVELEEVEDAELDRPQPGPINEDDEDSADFTDTGIFPPPSPFPSLLAALIQSNTSSTLQTPPYRPPLFPPKIPSMRLFPSGFLLFGTWSRPARGAASLLRRRESRGW